MPWHYKIMGTTRLRNIKPSEAERRRERRFQVDLSASVQAGEPGSTMFAVLVSDLSASGALIDVSAAECAYQLGQYLLLVLPDFGLIEAQVAHVGNQFYGLQFLTPHLLRDRLAAWLQLEVDGGPAC